MAGFPDFDGFPYYLVGSVSQAGAGIAPTMTLGDNKLPLGLGAWSYAAVGQYLYTLAGQFVSGRTFPFISWGQNPGGSLGIWIRRQTVNTLLVETCDGTGANADDILLNCSIAIIVLK